MVNQHRLDAVLPEIRRGTPVLLASGRTPPDIEDAVPAGGVQQEIQRSQTFARIGRVGHVTINNCNVHTRLL